MGNPLQKNTVMKFQGILGVIVLAAAGLLAWGHLNGLIFEERPVRAQSDAPELARAALDFHTDRGHWPLNSAGEPDLTLLLGHGAGRTATAMAARLGRNPGRRAIRPSFGHRAILGERGSSGSLGSSLPGDGDRRGHRGAVDRPGRNTGHRARPFVEPAR